MMMTKRKYDDFNVIIQAGDKGKLEKEVSEFSETLARAYIEDLLNKKMENIKKDLQAANRFQRLFEPLTTDRLSYSIGFFNAVIYIFYLLVTRERRKAGTEKRIKALLAKQHTGEILSYLLDHPDAQHKVIAEKLGLKSNYLSELMRELEENGCVERYASGKRSFYSLTLVGQDTAREQRRKRRSQLYFSRFSEAYADKYMAGKIREEERVSSLDSLKYSGIVMLDTSVRAVTKEKRNESGRMGSAGERNVENMAGIFCSVGAGE